MGHAGLSARSLPGHLPTPKDIPQGLKPANMFVRIAARLKSCPFSGLALGTLYPQDIKPNHSMVFIGATGVEPFLWSCLGEVISAGCKVHSLHGIDWRD